MSPCPSVLIVSPRLASRDDSLFRAEQPARKAREAGRE